MNTVFDREYFADIESSKKRIQEGDLRMYKKLFLTLMLILALALVACGGDDEEPTEETMTEETAEQPAEEPAEEPMEEMAVDELNILWAQWDPADYLQEIGNMYEAETGIKVNVTQEPWGSFGDLFFTVMAAGGDAYDMVVGDSQWLGQGATQGHYMNMTDFLVGEGIADTVTEATLTYYGEYPTGSGQYWAFPTEGDADGWAYRMDLFEDPDNMADFEAEYGYPLAVPETFEQLMDIANFFTRPDDGLYGVAIYTQADYDALTMGVENTMFSWGADWKDENNNVLGIVNSPEAVDSVQFYHDLYDCCQVPGLSNAFFAETNDALISGQAAMIMNYFAFFPALANAQVNPFAADTGYFVNPAGPHGDQHAALGGQGMSIINYISDEKKEASKDFIRWFAQEDIQAEWGAIGGYTCNKNVLATQEFLDVAPFNAAFAETMGFVKDFWNVPVFGELLTVAQQELGNFIVAGQGTAQEAMDNIANQHDEILREAGLITE
jgi:multiple sugar transport system substrate-binding protein